MVRQAAAIALGLSGDRRSVGALVAGLQDPEFGVKRIAASALARIGGPEAVSALIGVLRDSTENRSVRVLAEGGHFENHRDWHEMPFRVLVIRELQKIIDKGASDELISAIRDEDPLASGAAMYLLAGLGGDKAIETLLVELESRDPGRSNSAAFALGYISSPKIAEPLIRALRRGNIGAAISLGSLGAPSAVPALIKSLKYHPTHANENLSELPPFIRAFGLRRTDLRYFAAGALGRIGDPRAVDPLERIAQSDNGFFSRSAKRALEKIRAKQSETTSTKPCEPR